MEFFRGPKYISVPQKAERRPPEKHLWIKCSACQELIYFREFESNLKVCARCGHHFRLNAQERINLLADSDDYEELFPKLDSTDPLNFSSNDSSYTDKLAEARTRTGLTEAAICCAVTIGEVPVVLTVLDFGFMGASMGSVVGEKITRGIEEALRRGVALVTVSASGGARMQEGILSLMQMVKTSAALARLGDAQLPHISILTDPTTGGVTASFASLGDVIIAEPNALIGFAGPRVIEQTTKQKLPAGFQRSEFLLEHGMIDMVVPRSELKETLATVLQFYKPLLSASAL
jgi:acetyl-CoA carboxylase carboxyl transferase subunit beta